MADGYRRARAPLGAKAALLASPLSIKSASIFRAREAGTRAFKMRFSRPGMTLERFLRRPPRASDTHCSTLIGFIGMVFGSRPNFSSTAVHIRLRGSVICHTGNAGFRTHCPREHQAAPPPLDQFRAEMVGDVQMRHRTDPQGRSMQLPIKLQELAGISGAGIGDDKADVEIVGGFRKLVEKTLLRQIRHHVAVLNVKAFREALPHFVE